MSAPDLVGIDTKVPEWRTKSSAIQATIRDGREHRRLRKEFGVYLAAGAWDADVTQIRCDIDELGSRWWRFVSRKWRRARAALRQLCIGQPPSEYHAQLKLLDAIIQAQRLAASVRDAESEMRTLFRDSWRQADSDWDLFEAQAAWILSTQRGVEAGTLANWCLDAQRFRSTCDEASCRINGVVAAGDDFAKRTRTWKERLQFDETLLRAGPVLQQPFAELEKLWGNQASDISGLYAFVAVNQAVAECEHDQLAPVVRAAEGWEHAGKSLVTLFTKARVTALLDVAFRDRPALAGFEGLSHGKHVEAFRRLDMLRLKYNQMLLAAQHSGRMPFSGSNGQAGVLQREFERKRRFLPIRRLMAEAGNAVQAIKPVFMMSPLSIANYLPPGAVTFDLVIFDEASQVRPVDALGAIVRGSQAVVVGDSQQLPPTSFFDALIGQENDDDETNDTATTDIESILGLFRSRGAPQRMLEWHYRSRHESLIALSNHVFYDDRLVVFPSPNRERTGLGLKYRKIENAFYDRSRSRTNPVEAKAVATAVMAHARQQLGAPVHERETLGVAAFSVAQMDAILHQLELMRRADPSCEEFFSHGPVEPFFVKNLETVQGDERDVIFISVGYARTEQGYLAMSFGPLNRSGGERRLNVLITRARKRCEVFTALAPEDIDLERTSAKGAEALKAYLTYASTGRLDVPVPTGSEPDSDFEEAVLRALERSGYQVHPQVGSAGFRLDLAVVDPSRPGRYLIGIECDGARYHSARSARDRDRLRQKVLEDLGWRIHRIWSTEWFRNPEQELRRTVEAIEKAKIGERATPSAALEPFVEPPPGPKPRPGPRPKAYATPYVIAELRPPRGLDEIHVANRHLLASLLTEVVKVESPVHWLEAARRVANAAGVSKVGRRIREAFTEAIRYGHTGFRKRGNFLWYSMMNDPPLRDRSDLPASMKKLSLVAPEEVHAAILALVEDALGIAPDEIAQAVCRLLGFARVTDDMRSAVNQQRDRLIRSGRLVLKGTSLVAADEAPASV